MEESRETGYRISRGYDKRQRVVGQSYLHFHDVGSKHIEVQLLMTYSDLR
jgi:hypothetical protein